MVRVAGVNGNVGVDRLVGEDGVAWVVEVDGMFGVVGVAGVAGLERVVKLHSKIALAPTGD